MNQGNKHVRPFIRMSLALLINVGIWLVGVAVLALNFGAGPGGYGASGGTNPGFGQAMLLWSGAVLAFASYCI